MKIQPSEINHKTGGKRIRRKLEKKKKRKKNLCVQEAGNNSTDCSYYNATNSDGLDRSYEELITTRKENRDLYYSKSRMKDPRRYELQKKKYIDQLCSTERKFVNKRHSEPPIMFIGDRGFGIGSTIKDYMKFGGCWKQNIHARYSPVVIANEYHTSQTCVYCFQKLEHPYRIIIAKNGKRSLRRINEAFEFQNTRCIMYLTGRSVMVRDCVSALAIGLSELSRIIFGLPIPPFDHLTSQCNTEEYKQ